MIYVQYAWDSFRYISSKIYIPIPISATQVLKFNIISIIISLVILSIVLFFFFKIFGFGIDIFYGRAKRTVNNFIDSNNKKEKDVQNKTKK